MTVLDEAEVLSRELTTWRRAWDRRAGALTELERAHSAVDEACLTAATTVTAAEQAIGVLSSFADMRQDELQKKIETIVTSGLQAVFGPDLSFHARTSVRGKLAATEFLISSTQDGKPVETPVMDARGGGVAAVTGFLLRLVLLMLRDDTRKVMCLDESFAQLSAEYEPALAEFLRELVDKTDVQVVMVTHSTAFEDDADAVYRYRLVDGVTSVERTK